MLTQGFYRISCILNLLMIDFAGSEFVGNSGTIVLLMHMPQQDKDDEEKDKFYLELETIYSQCPRRDIKIVLGDFNAKVGKEESNYPYAGRNGLHEECNGNG